MRFVCCSAYYVITFKYYSYIYHDIIVFLLVIILWVVCITNRQRSHVKKQYIVSFQEHPEGYEGDKVLFNSVMEDDVSVIRM